MIVINHDVQNALKQDLNNPFFLAFTTTQEVHRDSPLQSVSSLRVLQLGGDFVLSEHGKVLFSHRCQSPVDRPPVEDILSALRT